MDNQVRMKRLHIKYRGRILRGECTTTPSPTTLLLHGAGSADRRRSEPFTDWLVAKGIGFCRFDFIGHGETGGPQLGTTLDMRYEQAALAARELVHPKMIIGFSMGGHTAIKLAIDLAFENLVLLYPAIYPDDAEAVPFGTEFSKAIRREGAWQDSSLFESLRKYRGKLLLIIGDEDRIIPKELPSWVVGHAESARYAAVLRVPGAGHSLIEHLSTNAGDANSVFRAISQVLDIEL